MTATSAHLRQPENHPDHTEAASLLAGVYGRAPASPPSHGVAMRSRRETVVNGISATKLEEIFELRIFLERHCARLAAQRATERQLQSMERLLTGHTRLQDVDLEGLIDIDRRFHRLLYAAADNAFMVDVLERLYDLSLPLWRVMHSRADDGRVWIEQHRILHRRVVDALKEGDDARAATLVEQQLAELQRSILAVV